MAVRRTPKRTARQPARRAASRAPKRTPAFVHRLEDALVRELDRAGLPAEVLTEPLAGTRLHRVTVVSPKFVHLWYSERQSLVWRIVDESLSRDEQFRISMILTLTPSDMAGESAA